MKKYLLLMIGLILVACGGNGTTSVGNPTGAVITIGRLSAAGSSTITIPLAVFGDAEADLTDASIDVTKNGTAIVTDLSPATYYSDSLEAVRFVLSGLSDGDTLVFDITLSDGTREAYEGTVSDSADTEATTDEEASADSVRPTEDGFMIYTDLSSAYEGVYVPATGSCFRSGPGDWEAFYVVENGDDVLADFLEDQEEDSVTFSDSTGSSFVADITNQVEDPGDAYAWTISCGFYFAAGAITGDCEITDVAAGVDEVALGDTCEVDYVLCDSLNAEDYFNSTTLHTGYSTAAELDALDACYEAN